jgi:hypothetical protein
MSEHRDNPKLVGRVPSHGAGVVNGLDAASGDAAYNTTRSTDVGRLPSAGGDVGRVPSHGGPVSQAAHLHHRRTPRQGTRPTT